MFNKHTSTELGCTIRQGLVYYENQYSFSLNSPTTSAFIKFPFFFFDKKSILFSFSAKDGGL